MEGPTPVSALIHAATMVTAGVYLLCRMNPLLHRRTAGAWRPCVVGAVTAFVAATIACAQQDIKKVLAFSTVSQIGYMVLAVGRGAYIAAIFLMVTHAFFKGLLFLGAGSVIHGLHDEQDLKRMGRPAPLHAVDVRHVRHRLAGHRRHPAALGLLGQGRRAGQRLCRPYKALWVVGIVTAVLTAYYMSRLDRAWPSAASPAFDKPATTRRAGPARAARVALGHARAPRRPGLLRLLRRRAGPALGAHAQPRELARPGLRRHALPRQPRARHPNGPWRSPTSRRRSSA